MKLQDFPLFRSTLLKALITVGAAALAFSLCDKICAAFGAKQDNQVYVEGREVKNFGRVNDHIYRGGQPDEGEYKKLAAMGTAVSAV